MPQRSYNNSDLKRFERKPLGVTVERPQLSDQVEPYDPSQEVDIDQLLANAKGTLGRANDLSRLQQRAYKRIDYANSGDQADTERYNDEVPSVMDSDSGRLGKLVSHYLKTRPDVVRSVAPFAAMAGGPIGMAGQVALAGSSAENLLDDEPDSALGIGIDTLGLVGGGAAALGGLRGILNGRRAASATAAAARQPAETVRETVNTARDYVSKGATSQQAAQRAGWPLGKSSASPVTHNASGDYIGRVMGEVGEMNKVGNAEVAASYAARQPKRDPLAGLRQAAEPAPGAPYRGSAESFLDDLLAGSPDNPALRALKSRLQGGDPYNSVLGPGGRR